MDAIQNRKYISCVLNAENGNEATMSIKKTAAPKNVVVIGGGIAGLEAARVAAIKGHHVTLFEKENKLGGQINIAAMPPRKSEILRSVEYYEKILPTLNVDIHLNEEVKDINDMVKNLTNGGKHQEIANTKHLYNRLCAYKHYSPFVMLPRYGGKITRMETTDEFLAISAALQSLYLAFLYVNQYQINKIDITDITEKYQKLLNILNSQYSVGN